MSPMVHVLALVIVLAALISVITSNSNIAAYAKKHSDKTNDGTSTPSKNDGGDKKGQDNPSSDVAPTGDQVAKDNPSDVVKPGEAVTPLPIIPTVAVIPTGAVEPVAVDCKTNPSDSTCNPKAVTTPIDCVYPNSNGKCPSPEPAPTPPIQPFLPVNPPASEVDCSKTPNDPSCPLPKTVAPVDCIANPTDPSCPPPSKDCEPSYPGLCLPKGSDLNCGGSSGLIAQGKHDFIVKEPDPYDLDRDGDGIGCEDGKHNSGGSNPTSGGGSKSGVSDVSNTYGKGNLQQIASGVSDFSNSNPSTIGITFIKTSKDIAGWYHVKGEIRNNSPNTLTSLNIKTHWYDAGMNIVGITASGYTDPVNVESGRTATFDALQDPNDFTDKPKFYKLSYDWNQ